jgi:SAM-dependent methyltransferase
MPEVIHELYEGREYPPMSHPLSDPAISAVAARMSGVGVPHPRGARILEIGCCSGHHLIPLAQRWPESEFVGIDLAESSIQKAREHAAEIGLQNIVFHVADLLDFQAGEGPFDFIIAHGFFSWVPNEVKAALLAFCRKNLSLSGIATVSFNLECGWKARFPVIDKVRAIQQARGGDEIEALEILSFITETSDPEAAIIADMIAKGPAILAFDEFGPINDPWPLDRFIGAVGEAGLRWLGESDPGENFPRGLSQESIREIRDCHEDALSFQMALDESAGRTFRSGMLCRDDAPMRDPASSSSCLDFSVRVTEEPMEAAAKELFHAIYSFDPACVPVRQIADAMPGNQGSAVLRQVLRGIHEGWIRPRIEPVNFTSEPAAFPRLDSFRLRCARQGLPLVDAWHMPCSFPAAHYPILAAMDGSRSYDELAHFSKTRCPELAFERWLRHLAYRGMFA